MPNPVLTSPPGSFPHSVLHDRHPKLIAKVRDGLPYSPDRLRALDELAEEITGAVRPLPPDAHDHDVWAQWGRDYLGESWYDVPFLWAESFFYRKLLEAVGYFRPGPWRGVDPFEPAKSAELRGRELADELDTLGARPDPDALLTASLWGNQADLGFQLQVRGGRASALVVDDSAAMWPLLTGLVCVVADNSGRELVPDLLLADHLLTTGRAEEILLHVKAYPYFTSDATMADVLAALRRLRGGPTEAAGERLWQAVRSGAVAVRAHPFSVAPWTYHEMPADLAEDFATATVTVMKGDLNYRRLVGDQAWPADTAFETVTEYFPGPVVAVRTLKSDVVVGVPADVLTRLESSGEPWRTNGSHALIQVSGGPAGPAGPTSSNPSPG
ncbi:damage-control phosphatase ARMT1 family protein [Actinophytocola sp.]|uniref:damage-control phosphatase ARMT1 family protein n=1 Tax=Actinophytocola sp. TaxID=1872138 RepID=UPI00389B0EB5